MGLIHFASDKEMRDARKSIVLNVAIPVLMEQGFVRPPYTSFDFGYYPGHCSYGYALCRLTDNGLIEFLRFDVVNRDPWIRITANVFQLSPSTSRLEDLNGRDGHQFQLPPNSVSEMELRSTDDHPGPWILWALVFGRAYRVGAYFTKWGFSRKAGRLSRMIERDMIRIDSFFDRWHQLHEPLKVDWNGHPLTPA